MVGTERREKTERKRRSSGGMERGESRRGSGKNRERQWEEVKRKRRDSRPSKEEKVGGQWGDERLMRKRKNRCYIEKDQSKTVYLGVGADRREKNNRERGESRQVKGREID